MHGKSSGQDIIILCEPSLGKFLPLPNSFSFLFLSFPTTHRASQLACPLLLFSLRNTSSQWLLSLLGKEMPNSSFLVEGLQHQVPGSSRSKGSVHSWWERTRQGPRELLPDRRGKYQDRRARAGRRYSFGTTAASCHCGLWDSGSCHPPKMHVFHIMYWTRRTNNTMTWSKATYHEGGEVSSTQTQFLQES